MARTLFLSSSFANTGDLAVPLLGGSPKDTTLGFVPTASDPYPVHPWYDEDLNKIQEMGFKLKIIDLKGKSYEVLKQEFTDVDVMFVVGGNMFYLLHHARKSGFDRLVKEWVEAGKFYIGSSAGSMLVGPTIEFKADMDDEYKHLCEGNYEAFNLADFAIQPHYNRPEYKEVIDRIVNVSDDTPYPLIPLRDTQAIIVKGNDYDITGVVPPQVKERKASTVIFYDDHGNVAFQDREGHSKTGGRYGWWGGGAELDESLEETIRRELNEELDFTPSDIRFWRSYAFWEYDEVRKEEWIHHVSMFISPITPELLGCKPKEGKGVVVMPIEQALQEKGFFPEDRRVLRWFQKEHFNRKIMILDTLGSFISETLNYIHTFGIEVGNLEMDHIGYQASSDEDYENLKVEFNEFAKLLSEEIIGGRRVGIYQLNKPFTYKNYTIAAIELIAPKQEQKVPSGLEHVEFVLKESFESFMKRYQSIPWDVGAINQSKFPLIKLKLSEHTKVKFHLKSVLDIVNK